MKQKEKNIFLPNPHYQMSLNEDQQIAFDAIVNEDENIYLCGPAGTGKTYLLQKVVEELENRGLKGLVTATTGMAAENLKIEEAMTLHKAMKWQSDKAGTSFNNILGQTKKERNFGVKMATKFAKDIDYIIIEEVSLLTDIQFDIITQQLHFKQHLENLSEEERKVLENVDDWMEEDYRLVEKLFIKITTDMRKQFVNYTATPKLILVGDLKQLAPIGNKYFINSLLYPKCNFRKLELQIPQRQKDPAFLNILTLLRDNQFKNETIENFLFQIYTKNLANKKTRDASNEIHLFTRNQAVQMYNATMVKELRPDKSITTKPEIQWYIPEERRSYTIRKELPNMESICIFKGMRVMLTKNTATADIALRNSDVGTVIAYREYFKTKRDKTRSKILCVNIKFDKHEEPIDIETIEEVKYFPNQHPEDDEAIRRRIFKARFLPIVSGYGFVIHKIQGQTLEKFTMHIDSQNPIFSAGQLYTMISRAKTMEGIKLDIGNQTFEEFYKKICFVQANSCDYPESIKNNKPEWTQIHTEELKNSLLDLKNEQQPWSMLLRMAKWNEAYQNQTLRRKIIKIRNEILNEKSEASGSSGDEKEISVLQAQFSSIKLDNDQIILQTIRKIIGESSTNSVATNGVECPKCSKKLSANHLMQIGIYCECEATKMEICQQIINKYPWFTYILQDKRYTSLSQPVRYIGIATTKNRIKQSEKIRELDNSNDIVRISLNVGETDMIRMIKTNGDKQNKQLMGNAEYSNHFRDLSKKDKQDASIVPMKTDYVVNLAFTKIFKKIFDSRVIASYNTGDLIRGNKALHCHDTIPKSCYRSEIVICHCERKCGYTSMKNKLMEREPYWGIPSNEIRKYWNKSKTDLHTLTKTKTNIAMIKKKERIKAIYNHDSYNIHGNNNRLSLLKHQIKMAIMWRNGNIDEVKTINENPNGTQILGMMNLAMIKEQVKLKSNDYYII